MAIETGLGAGVILGAGSGFEESGAGTREPEIVVSSVLAGLILFAMAQLGVESLFGLLRKAEPL